VRRSTAYVRKCFGRQCATGFETVYGPSIRADIALATTRSEGSTVPRCLPNIVV
jgi:hypothetical protein